MAILVPWSFCFQDFLLEFIPSKLNAQEAELTQKSDELTQKTVPFAEIFFFHGRNWQSGIVILVSTPPLEKVKMTLEYHHVLLGDASTHSWWFLHCHSFAWIGGVPGTSFLSTWIGCLVEQWKKGPWLFRGFVGNEILPSYVGTIMNHGK